MSQLLLRLEQELKQANEPNRRAILNAQIASNLARLGRFAEAKEKIAIVRDLYGDGRSGEVTVWLMLAEGLVSLYADLSPNSMERIKRAQALSIAMNYPTMVAIASAWKAHLEFENSQFEQMNESLKIAIFNAADTDLDAKARIAIVVSNALMHCGNHSDAMKWFTRGRGHAVANGDRASIEALLYNRTAFTLAWLRVLHCKNQLTSSEIKKARFEIDSTINLNKLTGIESFSNHLQLCVARLLILECRYVEAIEQLTQVRSRSPFATHNFNSHLIDLEVCFCRFQLRDREEAHSAFSLIEAEAFQKLDLDEKIVSQWMRWQMSIEDGRFGNSQTHATILRELIASHTETCLQLSSKLNWLEAEA